MAAVTVSEKLRRELSAAARQRRKQPETLAEEALCDFLQRLCDEEPLARSERAARCQRFRIGGVEELVRQHRRQASRV